ncbi:hypothetical protein [Streptomyces sp. NPDC005303]|uniref:hypothetical protein n=1 Tax=Streptomyces sp. NPDC005303 TaxID=3155713 RepID=UPI0033B6D830
MAFPPPHLQGSTVVSRPQNLHLLSHLELSFSPCREAALLIGEDIPRTGAISKGVIGSRTAISVAEISKIVRRAGELAWFLHRHNRFPNGRQDRSRTSEGCRDVVCVAGTVGDRLTDLLCPLPEQLRALTFPMRQDVLDSGFKAFLDTAASDEFVAQISPTLSHRLHGSCVCALNHGLHLVHVAIKPEFRGGLCCEALVRGKVFQTADALATHGYCPLISMKQNTCHFPWNAA